MLINGQVGPQSLGDGTNPPLRLDKTGAQVVTELHGKFFETNYRGNLFLAANAAAGTAISAAAAASTWTLWNPLATKNASAPFGQIIDQPDGTIIVAPGSGLSLVSVGADTTPLWNIGMAWEEVPV